MCSLLQHALPACGAVPWRDHPRRRWGWCRARLWCHSTTGSGGRHCVSLLLEPASWLGNSAGNHARELREWAQQRGAAPAAAAEEDEDSRVSWAKDESLQTVVFLPPTARALILRALEMVNIWVDDKERCNGVSVRAFFQASLLRLHAWETDELGALRPEYTNRYTKAMRHQQEYARAWSVLAGWAVRCGNRW